MQPAFFAMKTPLLQAFLGSTAFLGSSTALPGPPSPSHLIDVRGPLLTCSIRRLRLQLCRLQQLGLGRHLSLRHELGCGLGAAPLRRFCTGGLVGRRCRHLRRQPLRFCLQLCNALRCFCDPCQLRGVLWVLH